jgi:hypothetical protein
MKLSGRIIDFVSGSALVVLGAVIWWEGANMPPSFLDTRFGSGYMMQLGGGALAVLSAWFVIQSVLASSSTDDFRFSSELKQPSLVVIMLAAFIFNISLDLIPFYLSIAVFIFVIAAILGSRTRQQLIMSAVIAALLTGLCWLMFNTIMKVYI